MATVTLGTLLTFAVTCLVIELTPGPNMAYLAILSATKGRRAGFAATLGVAVGLSMVGLAAVLGLTVLVANSPMLYEVLRWGGVVYLLWLAYEGWYGRSTRTRHLYLDARSDETLGILKKSCWRPVKTYRVVTQHR